jgi:hypothetical protein
MPVGAATVAIATSSKFGGTGGGDAEFVTVELERKSAKTIEITIIKKPPLETALSTSLKINAWAGSKEIGYGQLGEGR